MRRAAAGTGSSSRERHELLDLPEQRWEPVAWRTAKVHRDWHIQIDSIKYSVPYRFAGLGVDVRIIGDTLDVIADGEIIATHRRGQRSNGYVTDPEHQPAHLRRQHEPVDARLLPAAGRRRSARQRSPRWNGCSTSRRSRRRASGPA
ncbi:MAG: hypothetical protein V9G09_12060 [Candidatus Nanopelagicales bacterium]